MTLARTRLLAALATALAVLLPSFAPPAAALTDCDADHPVNDAEELAFLGIINTYRADRGLHVLTISVNLNREAGWMARDMAANRYFGHYDSLGRHPWVRSVDCGYPIPAGENLAAGWRQGGAQAAFDLFRSSPTHNTNMLQREYRQIGIARIWDERSPYGWYWATEFGTTDDGSVNTPARPQPAGAEAAARFSNPAPTAAAREGPPAAAVVPPRVLHGAWDRGETAPRDALELLGTRVTMIYVWDPGRGTWRHFGPELPAFVETLDVLDDGMKFWVIHDSRFTIHD